MYSKVGRLFIKAQKKQVVWAASVMREEGITVDKVMDLFFFNCNFYFEHKNGTNSEINLSLKTGSTKRSSFLGRLLDSIFHSVPVLVFSKLEQK